MRRLLWLTLGVAGMAGIALGACEFPTFQFKATTTTTTTSSVTQAGGAGGGGAGGDSSGSGGFGGSGGCGPSHDVCTGTEKCSVVDVLSGARGCVERGPRGEGERCFDDAECEDGLYCDLGFTSVCRRVCANGNACVSGAQCVQAGSGGVAIPGLKLCTSHCDPGDTAACPQTAGATNCITVVSASDFTCASTTNLNTGSTCVDSLDCAAGLLCVSPGAPDPTTCEAWCTPVSNICPGFNWCYPLTPKAIFDAVEYGACMP